MQFQVILLEFYWIIHIYILKPQFVWPFSTIWPMPYSFMSIWIWWTLGWLIHTFLSSFFCTPILLGDLKNKEGQKIILFVKNIFSSPLMGGQPLKKYVDDSLKLRFNKSDSMQKESAQMDDLRLRKLCLLESIQDLINI